MQQSQRRLAAIMFTDIVGYGVHTQRNEALALDLLAHHNELLRPIIANHRGDEVKSMGDGFLLEFASALDAVRCATQMQKTLHRANKNADEDHHIQIRIGIHLGDVEHRDGDVFGDGVNIASRLEALAEPGKIYLSADVARQVQNKTDWSLVSLGEKSLKNMDGSIEVFCLEAPYTSTASTPLRRSFKLKPALVLTGILVLIMAGVLLLNLNNSLPGSSELAGTGSPLNSETPANKIVEDEIESIAVLPFINLSADEDNEYFSDGLTEEIINAVAQINGLRVISRTSAFSYKGTDMDVRTIGEELGVDAVLEGSVRKEGSTVRITTQLIRVSDDSHLWSETFEQEIEDVFDIQESIAQTTASTLELQLENQLSPLVERSTENFEAYEAYLRGRFFWNKRTKEGFEKAVEYFERAIELDPNYAQAYAGLADTYSLMVGYDHIRSDEGFSKARESSEQAIALNNQLAEAHTSLGMIADNYDLKKSAAEEHYQAALDINPNYVTALHWYSNLLFELGRTDESMAMIQRALKLDPLSPIINANLGQKYAQLQDYDNAMSRFEKALELDPDFLIGHLSLAGIKQFQWDWEGALTSYQDALSLNPDYALSHHAYALTLLQLEQWEEGFEEIQTGLDLNSNTALGHFVLGVYHYFNHDLDKTIVQMNKTLLRDKKFGMAYYYLAMAYSEKEQFNDALEAVRSRVALSDEQYPSLQLFNDLSEGIIYARMGDVAQAVEVIEQLEETPPQPATPLWTAIAAIYFELGQLNQAFAWLEKAFENRDIGLLSIKVDPLFDAGRNDPRFQDLVKRMNLDFPLAIKPDTGGKRIYLTPNN